MNLEQPTMYLQALKMKLHEYWSAQGCSIMEPHDVEKGAGTMNPFTFLEGRPMDAMVKTPTVCICIISTR